MRYQRKELSGARQSTRHVLPALLCAVALVFLGFSQVCRGETVRKATPVRNGSFNEQRGGTPPGFTQKSVEDLRQNGWKCPDIAEWPQSWGVYGNNGTVEFPATGGVKSDGFARISGPETFLIGYHGWPLEDCNYIYTVWARGTGTLQLHVTCWGTREQGDFGQLVAPGETVPDLNVQVASGDQWVRYRHLLVKPTPRLQGVNPWLRAQAGILDVDEVDISASTPALDLIVAAEEKLYGTGALIENLDLVKPDDLFMKNRQAYQDAVAAFHLAKAKLDKELAAALEQEMSDLAPYVLTKNLTVVRAIHYNEMIVLTGVLNTLAGKEPVKPAAVKAQAAPAVSAAGYKPGERAARPDAVTVTEVRSDKVRYDENETAETVATIANQTGAAVPATLVANMIVGLDEAREIGRSALTLNPGENKWNFSYSVGPETYGRAVEVQCLNEKGEQLDRWQEYYSVAADWTRVMVPCGAPPLKSYRTDYWATYVNQSHDFASEPTDYGVQIWDFDDYLSPQANYQLNMPARKARIAGFRKIGARTTFYQNCSYSGQMGYEVIRQHPEFSLYDENGQFAVDPVYGGYPSPMEIASPIEIGPKRKVTKPYLDRKVAPWGHSAVNTARLDVIEFEANAVREYARFLGVDGVYTDGNWGVTKGYGYDGKPNVNSDDHVECMRINARNHRVFAEILRQDNPHFGTWYNWAYDAPIDNLRRGVKSYVGSGAEGDVGNDTILAAAAGNTMFLMEHAGQFRSPESPDAVPETHLNMLADNRDFTLQRSGASVIVGYLFPWADLENPGVSRWGWPTHNYFGAQIVATQHHAAMGFVPSMRPWIQFQIRYSRYVWAPEVKVVPDAGKIVKVATTEELWWKRLVYKLLTAQGYELIVHLVRIPPTKLWDIAWPTEPLPLTDVSLLVDLGQGQLRDAWALRPYDFEEEQQAVQQTVPVVTANGQAAVAVPPFRYHTMLVLRVISSKD